MKKLIALALVAVMATGCTGLGLKKYDVITVQNIQATIDHEKFVSDFMIKTLEEIDAPPGVIAHYQVMTEAEMIRLNMWLEYEQAKQLEDK